MPSSHGFVRLPRRSRTQPFPTPSRTTHAAGRPAATFRAMNVLTISCGRSVCGPGLDTLVLEAGEQLEPVSRMQSVAC